MLKHCEVVCIAITSAICSGYFRMSDRNVLKSLQVSGATPCILSSPRWQIACLWWATKPRKPWCFCWCRTAPPPSPWASPCSTAATSSSARRSAANCYDCYMYSAWNPCTCRLGRLSLLNDCDDVMCAVYSSPLWSAASFWSWGTASVTQASSGSCTPSACWCSMRACSALMVTLFVHVCVYRNM